jgi:hypothetical protein
MKIRVIEEDYMNIFENIIKNKIAYPKKNPCFNLSFSKFYGNQYLFCVRNVILYKQLVENLDLYPGIFKYSKDEEGNIHDNNDLSNIFIWTWQNYYQTYIFFVGDLDIKNLKITVNKNIIPYTLISPNYTYKVPKYFDKLRPDNHNIPMEDFRLFFSNGIMYVYDSCINTIQTMALYKNKLILNKRYEGICEIKFLNTAAPSRACPGCGAAGVWSLRKTPNNYEKIFEKNWSLYKVISKNKKDTQFKFIHDYEIDGLYGVSYFPQKNNCKKVRLIKYADNTFPIDNKFIRFSVGTPCIEIQKGIYLGVGHIKIKYNYLKAEMNDIKTDLEKHYIKLGRKVHNLLKEKYGKAYRPHRWIIYMGYFFKYDVNNNTFFISNLFMPLPKYKYVFSLSFPMSLQKINDNIIISGGLGDYTTFLINMNQNKILKDTKFDISDFDIKDLKVYFVS